MIIQLSTGLLTGKICCTAIRCGKFMLCVFSLKKPVSENTASSIRSKSISVSSVLLIDVSLPPLVGDGLRLALCVSSA